MKTKTITIIIISTLALGIITYFSIRAYKITRGEIVI